jgi:hypothetical protein
VTTPSAMDKIPSIGLLTATALVGTVGHITNAHEPVTRLQEWALTVQARRGHNKATIAVANTRGRIVWAVWTRDVAFDPPPVRREAACRTVRTGRQASACANESPMTSPRRC